MTEKIFKNGKKEENYGSFFTKAMLEFSYGSRGAAIFRVPKNTKEKDFLCKCDRGKVLNMN